MTDTTLNQEWLRRPERGALPLIKLTVWLSLRLGRRLARLLLYPMCLYFVAFSPKASRNSRVYLARALGRAPRFTDIFAHFLTFGSCLLDRLFLLNGQSDQFDITVHGEEILRDIERQGDGCLLFGAHFGSFEAARAMGRQACDLPISLLMYEKNAVKVRAALAAINPQLQTEVIGLGQAHSLITAAERLKRGHLIGVLADRDVKGKDFARFPFLGAMAAFPRGPFRLALLLKRPVVMMIGVYRGGRRYEIHFETLVKAPEGLMREREQWVEAAMARYVSRLEHYCRDAPTNWFNFYDFWA